MGLKLYIRKKKVIGFYMKITSLCEIKKIKIFTPRYFILSVIAYTQIYFILR